jgi:hypothetical protein
MDKCLHCGNDLTHVEGRKKKSFCNVNCRNKYFYAKNKKLVEQARQIVPKPVAPIPPPPNEILAKIKAVRDEKIPPTRDTALGRKAWGIEQQKRIKELEQLLK